MLRSDEVILREMMMEDPTNPRTVFNLAKCIEGLGKNEEACALYHRRSQMGGLEEECWYAGFKYGALLAKVSSFEDGAYELLKAWSKRPFRAEPLRTLAEYCEHIADKLPLPTGELFFVQRSAYKPQAPEGKQDATAQGQ